MCFLDVSPEEAAKRGGFGNERYETQAFQAKVRANYNNLIEDNWQIVSTDGKTLDQVFDEIKAVVDKTVQDTHRGPEIEQLWPVSD